MEHHTSSIYFCLIGYVPIRVTDTQEGFEYVFKMNVQLLKQLLSIEIHNSVMISSVEKVHSTPNRRRILPNFLLVWLNANITSSSDDSQNTLQNHAVSSMTLTSSLIQKIVLIFLSMCRREKPLSSYLVPWAKRSCP